ncbi:MAG: PIN domain nuclease [Sulfobacillus acidophilus]|uniref:PIN domain nuclease n=1 Tax=Sulfobacillus acidophilus TaxID=53633 RepID=A0A2T2WD67_9FIRM|nr:MAG: PIN domain nuclease [Sulfobacillus acidophilus]
MMLRLDTQIYLWCLVDSPGITSAIAEQITEVDGVFVRTACIWEASSKIGLGKLEAQISDLVQGIEASGFMELPVSTEDAGQVASLAPIHQDPFDGLLVA